MSKIFWIVWIVISSFLIATWLTDLEVTSRMLNKGLACIFISGLIGLAIRKTSWTVLKKFVFLILVFVVFLTLSHFLDWRGDWKTQTVIFRNNHLSNRTIEFQLQDKGAFGYNRRTVDRVKIFPFVSWTKTLTEQELENIDSVSWDKVDIHVNEQGLKGG